MRRQGRLLPSLLFLPLTVRKRPTVEKRLRRGKTFSIMQSKKGVKAMQIEIRIDGAYPEPKVVILTAAVT